jgi:hypothetical protein
MLSMDRIPWSTSPAWEQNDRSPTNVMAAPSLPCPPPRTTQRPRTSGAPRGHRSPCSRSMHPLALGVHLHQHIADVRLAQHAAPVAVGVYPPAHLQGAQLRPVGEHDGVDLAPGPHHVRVHLARQLVADLEQERNGKVKRSPPVNLLGPGPGRPEHADVASTAS